MKVLTKEQTKIVEDSAVKSGMDCMRMMENAGSACARLIRRKIEAMNLKKVKCAVFCGNGNNGGDGFVVSRKLFEAGFEVSIVLVQGMTDSDIAMEMLLRAPGVVSYDYESDYSIVKKMLLGSGIIVDAIYGIGFRGNPDNRTARAIKDINAAKGYKISIDIPSGTECDSGLVRSNAIKADLTIAITSYNPVHITYPGAEYCGKTEVVPIGIPSRILAGIESRVNVTDKTQVKCLLPERSRYAHKGNFGHLLSICGSIGMPGAAVLAAKAAIRMGAGLVSAAFPKEIYNPLSSQLTEALLLPVSGGEFGAFTPDSADIIIQNQDRYNTVLLGCGLGFSDDTCNFVYRLIESLDCEIIIDADGINAVSRNIDILKRAKKPVILTPHPGEMSRLTGISLPDIESSRISTASDFAMKHGATLVLKGTNTVIAGSDRICVNPTGNPGMAKGGSGDVLAGMIASLSAQGLKPMDAAVAGVYLHGLAGDIAAEKFGEQSMIPSDLIAEIPSAVLALG